jgi:hypothetical protein
MARENGGELVRTNKYLCVKKKYLCVQIRFLCRLHRGCSGRGSRMLPALQKWLKLFLLHGLRASCHGTRISNGIFCSVYLWSSMYAGLPFISFISDRSLHLLTEPSIYLITYSLWPWQQSGAGHNGGKKKTMITSNQGPMNI